MTSTELIRFRKLDSELTDDEFFHKFCKTIGRETIVSALYNQFKKNLNETKRATTIQSNIMLKREKKPQQQTSYDCIDQLPSELISECGSWLHFEEYFKFGRCNRNIYYSLYSHPKIHRLALGDIIHKLPQSANLCAFRNIKELTMNIKSFNELSSLNKATWQNNDSLREAMR